MKVAVKSTCHNCRNRIFEYVWMFSLAVCLFLYYISNLKNINIIWELPDEAGYLYNAAYFAGKDWSSYTSVGKSFYGYGYSLILIPLFFICKTGVQLVKAAVLLNYFLVICTFFLQNYIFSKIFKQNKYIIAFACFIINFFPYMVVSANKVICETFLNFQIWVIAVMLFKLLDTDKKIYYILTGFFTGYIYLIHTRAIAVIGAVSLLLIVYTYIKKDKKFILFFFISLFLVLVIGQGVKSQLISTLYSGNSSGNSEVTNLLGTNFLAERLKWLFNIENVGSYIVSACCRFFYVVVTTGLMVLWSLKHIASRFSVGIKKFREWKADSWILIYFSTVFLIMFTFCCLSGSGLSSDFTYAFYGRYIEYVLSPLVGIGILSYLNLDKHNTALILMILIILGVMTGLEINYLDTDDIRADTARIAGFTFWILKNSDYLSFAYSQTLLITTSYIFMILAQRERIKYTIFIFLTVLFLANDKECIKIINGVHRGKSSEIEVSDYIDQRMDQKKIYFINIGYQYKWDYIRMQALLPNEPLIVINAEEYGKYPFDGAYLIAYTNTDIVDELSEYYSLVLYTHTYSLFESN